MTIRAHTLNNKKLIELPLPILSTAVTKLYATDKGLVKQFERMLLGEEYVTPMIYLVKRVKISFEIELLQSVLEEIRDDLRIPLYLSFKSFLDKGDTHAFSMYLVKNRHIEYVR